MREHEFSFQPDEKKIQDPHETQNPWREEINKIEAAITRGEPVPHREFDTNRMFELVKDGVTVPSQESLAFDGQSYELIVKLEGEKIASLRYRLNGNKISMGKTTVDKKFRRQGINSRLFEEMTMLNPDAKEVFTSMDDTNPDIYLSGLKNGLNPLEAARRTPAARVREKAGW